MITSEGRSQERIRPVPYYETKIVPSFQVYKLELSLAEAKQIGHRGIVPWLAQKLTAVYPEETELKKAFLDPDEEKYSFRVVYRQQEGVYKAEGYYEHTLAGTYQDIAKYGADYDHQGWGVDAGYKPSYLIPSSYPEADTSVCMVFKEDKSQFPTVKMDLIGCIEVHWVK